MRGLLIFVKKYDVYLAGPDVFRADAPDHAEKVKAICKAAGLRSFFPLDAQANDPRAIFEKNCEAIRASRIVIANLAPFRGPNVDDGTAWEIGYAFALNKPVFGYSSDGREYKNRVDRIDPDFTLVEDFGGICNLMLWQAIELSGGSIHRDIEACVSEAARKLL